MAVQPAFTLILYLTSCPPIILPAPRRMVKVGFVTLGEVWLMLNPPTCETSMTLPGTYSTPAGIGMETGALLLPLAANCTVISNAVSPKHLFTSGALAALGSMMLT